MEWIVGLFSGKPGDMSRVNGWGILVIALGVTAVALARRLAGEKDKWFFGIKLAGLVLVMLGTALSVRLI